MITIFLFTSFPQRRFFKDMQHNALEKKSNMEYLEKEIGLKRFLPKSVIEETKVCIRTTVELFSTRLSHVRFSFSKRKNEGLYNTIVLLNPFCEWNKSVRKTGALRNPYLYLNKDSV